MSTPPLLSKPLSQQGPLPTRQSNLVRLLRVMEEFRQLEPDLPSQVIHAFLAAALTPGLSIRDLQDRLGMSSASASRSFSFLSDQHRLGKEGLGLIRYEGDAQNGRIKRVFLTTKGQRLVERLNFFLGEA